MNLAKVVAELERSKTELQERVKGIDVALVALQGSKTGRPRLSRGRKRLLSPAARKRIVDAQKARWAKYRKRKRQ